MLKKISISILSLFLLMLFGGLSWLYSTQESQIFNFDPVADNHDYQFPDPHEEIWLENGDAKLHGVFYPTQSDRRGVVLYFKGNAGNIGRSPKMANTFLKRGFDVVAMDYRQFGKSKGELSEAALLRDAEVWYDYTRARFPDDDLRIVGYSLGTTFSSHIAAVRNPEHVLLFAPMKSILDMAQRRFVYVPDFMTNYPFRNDLKLARSNAEIIIFHGLQDKIVPHASGAELKTVLNADDHFYTIDEANHLDLPWRSDVLTILDQHW
ncbi:alpha/beta hydrolase [Kordiimonas sp. SCSIO 12610]|uniref:alpha/beta hydrolase n=1 Tax=Kordiimonas sp. SCSIO 12610 TaxID=2829597 RepID=UPI00210EDE7C|nr:alpha/beta fold hydrolase [Kordiimonas sp. SCSIO 12610]UTW53880.1 alpha/beta fold hydrolase [Kordiimonas sp. SCSIO 12610]